jgi:hypothetical protein
MKRMHIKHLRLLPFPEIANMLLLILFGASSVFAQADNVSSDLNPENKTAESNYTGSGSLASFFSSLSDNRHNPVGLNFSAYQLYTTNAIQNETSGQPANISIIRSQIFTNVGRKQTHLHLDFTGGYRFYRDHEELNNAEANGYISYEHQINRRLGIKFFDRLSSQTTDFALSSGFGPLQQSQLPSTSFTLLHNYNRVTLNELQGELGLKLSRNSSLGFFSGYQIYRTDNVTIKYLSADILQAGIYYDYKFTRWMSFSSNWSTYLNDVASESQNSKVYRAEIGGFHFKLSRYWNFNISGGVNILDTKGIQRRLEASERTFLSHSSQNNTLIFAYQRGFISANGLANVLHSNIFSADFGQRLSKRLRLRMSGSCFLSRDSIGSNQNQSAIAFLDEHFKSYSASTSLEFKVLHNMVALINAGYQNQNNRSHPLAGYLTMDRYIASFGLQYFFPSLSQ